jgi:hypothetical protein
VKKVKKKAEEASKLVVLLAVAGCCKKVKSCERLEK